jgi:hypothetical protein
MKLCYSVTVVSHICFSFPIQWKQAKEELHGSDAEEDDKEFYDLEVIEKKKQKEIEVPEMP